ncbi:uncharacterized protein L201_002495 [Kwoniella dendrophila CBS 6074]|uniref:Uncharacterized protein n=1 Tax=Kwoniella dendrophila CBS 6074 TaxID=1295534 RepID=A0AAX4JSX4_9TREE
MDSSDTLVSPTSPLARSNTADSMASSSTDGTYIDPKWDTVSIPMVTGVLRPADGSSEKPRRVLVYAGLPSNPHPRRKYDRLMFLTSRNTDDTSDPNIEENLPSLSRRDPKPEKAHLIPKPRYFPPAYGNKAYKRDLGLTYTTVAITKEGTDKSDPTFTFTDFTTKFPHYCTLSFNRYVQQAGDRYTYKGYIEPEDDINAINPLGRRGEAKAQIEQMFRLAPTSFAVGNDAYAWDPRVSEYVWMPSKDDQNHLAKQVLPIISHKEYIGPINNSSTFVETSNEENEPEEERVARRRKAMISKFGELGFSDKTSRSKSTSVPQSDTHVGKSWPPERNVNTLFPYEPCATSVLDSRPELKPELEHGNETEYLTGVSKDHGEPHGFLPHETAPFRRPLDRLKVVPGSSDGSIEASLKILTDEEWKAELDAEQKSVQSATESTAKTFFHTDFSQLSPEQVKYCLTINDREEIWVPLSKFPIADEQDGVIEDQFDEDGFFIPRLKSNPSPSGIRGKGKKPIRSPESMHSFQGKPRSKESNNQVRDKDHKQSRSEEETIKRISEATRPTIGRTYSDASMKSLF